jgi:hypothetical protein
MAKNRERGFYEKRNISKIIDVVTKYTEIFEIHSVFIEISRRHPWGFKKFDSAVRCLVV